MQNIMSENRLLQKTDRRSFSSNNTSNSIAGDNNEPLNLCVLYAFDDNTAQQKQSEDKNKTIVILQQLSMISFNICHLSR